MNKLFKIVLAIAVVLDVLSFYLTNFIPRHITFFIPIPLLLINYVSKVSKPNLMYLLSFIFTYIGTTLYYLTPNPNNVISYFSIAVFFYSIALVIYNYLIFREINYTKRNLLQFFVLYAVCMFLPIYFFYNQLRIDDFVAMIMYSANTIMFFQLTYMLKQKNRLFNLVFIASCIFLFSSFCSGVYYFYPVEAFKIISAIGVLTFWITHILMSLHVIKNSKLLKEELK